MKTGLTLTLCLLCALPLAACSSMGKNKNRTADRAQSASVPVIRQLPHTVTPEVHAFFENIERAPYASFAYTAETPAYIFDGDVRTSIGKAYYYIANLRDGNGDLMNYLGRYSMENPSHKDKGGRSSARFLDVYSYINGADTLSIYVNVYEKGELFIPAGLTFAGE